MIVAVYLFALVPAISHIEVLIIALAPTFLLYGFLIARPATTGTGMALAANTATLLAIQSTYSADFASYANSAVAFFVGVVIAGAGDPDFARRGRRMDRQSPGAVELEDACRCRRAPRQARSCRVRGSDAAPARAIGPADRLPVGERSPATPTALSNFASV